MIVRGQEQWREGGQVSKLEDAHACRGVEREGERDPELAVERERGREGETRSWQSKATAASFLSVLAAVCMHPIAISSNKSAFSHIVTCCNSRHDRCLFSRYRRREGAGLEGMMTPSRGCTGVEREERPSLCAQQPLSRLIIRFCMNACTA